MYVLMSMQMCAHICIYKSSNWLPARDDGVEGSEETWSQRNAHVRCPNPPAYKQCVVDLNSLAQLGSLTVSTHCVCTVIVIQRLWLNTGLCDLVRDLRKSFAWDATLHYLSKNVARNSSSKQFEWCGDYGTDTIKQQTSEATRELGCVRIDRYGLMPHLHQSAVVSGQYVCKTREISIFVPNDLTWVC